MMQNIRYFLWLNKLTEDFERDWDETVDLGQSFLLQFRFRWNNQFDITRTAPISTSADIQLIVCSFIQSE